MYKYIFQFVLFIRFIQILETKWNSSEKPKYKGGEKLSYFNLDCNFILLNFVFLATSHFSGNIMLAIISPI